MCHRGGEAPVGLFRQRGKAATTRKTSDRARRRNPSRPDADAEPPDAEPNRSLAVSSLAALPQPTSRPCTPESILVMRLKAGDADAFEELVRTAGGRLLAVARRFLRDEEAARDAVQETFLSAFR